MKTLNGVWDYSYSGTQEMFIVPIKGRYKLECWGAQGAGSHLHSELGLGGLGGYSVMEIDLERNEVLNVYVGGAGTIWAGSAGVAPGGFNGGGAGIKNTNSNIDPAASGGGATDIRRYGSELTDRIIIAGGGGGGGMDGENAGHGGGLEGGNGSKAPSYTKGGTQTGGYALGVGQDGPRGEYYGGAGGGGGLYGGRTYSWYGAGGGSGYVSEPGGITTGGNQSFIQPDGTVSVGRQGHGHARITLIEHYYKANFQHYYIRCNGKNYITSRQFIDNNYNFIAVPDSTIMDISNEKIEFITDIQQLLKPIYIGETAIYPLAAFSGHDIKIVKYIGCKYQWSETNKNNLNNNNTAIIINHSFCDEIINHSFIETTEFTSINHALKKYRLFSDKNIVKVAFFYNGSYIGQDFKEIQKNEIHSKGFDVNELNNVNIPFDKFRLIFVFVSDNEEFNYFKLYMENSKCIKKINRKYYNIFYDEQSKKILIISSIDTNRLIVQKLSKHLEESHVISSIEEI